MTITVTEADNNTVAGIVLYGVGHTSALDVTLPSLQAHVISELRNIHGVTVKLYVAVDCDPGACVRVKRRLLTELKPSYLLTRPTQPSDLLPVSPAVANCSKVVRFTQLSRERRAMSLAEAALRKTGYSPPQKRSPTSAPRVGQPTVLVFLRVDVLFLGPPRPAWAEILAATMRSTRDFHVPNWGHFHYLNDRFGVGRTAQIGCYLTKRIHYTRRATCIFGEVAACMANAECHGALNEVDFRFIRIRAASTDGAATAASTVSTTEPAPVDHSARAGVAVLGRPSARGSFLDREMLTAEGSLARRIGSGTSGDAANASSRPSTPPPRWFEKNPTVFRVGSACALHPKYNRSGRLLFRAYTAPPLVLPPGRTVEWGA